MSQLDPNQLTLFQVEAKICDASIPNSTQKCQSVMTLTYEGGGLRNLETCGNLIKHGIFLIWVSMEQNSHLTAFLLLESLCGALRAHKRSTMQCTPTSNVILQSYKGQRCYEDCSDSGYSGWFQSPRTITGVDFSGSLSPSEINETPKENLRLPVTPKEQSRESVRVLGKDTREAASVVSWCETPKLNRRGTFQRHKLLTSKPALVKDDSTGSPFTTNAESFSSKRSEHWLSASFDSLDFTAGGATSSLNMGQDLALSGRKRRILFTQVRTSTREDGKLNTYPLPSFEGSVSITEADFRESISAHEIDKLFPSITKDNFQSPVSSETDILCDRSGAFYTPSFTQTPKNTT
ncbi:hypothetical protein GOODEAATRI_012878 [Goodea atripinnis]|uniref:Uncharacterized protein n=1 Tax=Goodea atripinnis TaxID=208336 RepID=A0ABV0N0Y7_9TELE